MGDSVSLARAIGLVLGVIADSALGDPRTGHPVAAFGTTASRLEKALYRDHRLAGAAHVGILVGATVTLGVLTERLGRRNPVMQTAATAVATWVVLGGSSLAAEGAAMARALDSGQIEDARERLPNLCGRDASALDTNGLARATVESVAENTSDAVVAPLFWGAVAGVPGLIGYRAINTLDAMIGHRSPRYNRFGWAAARLDDLANLAPARAAALLTALCAPVVGGSASTAWRTWRRDAAAHPSPNAGQIEAAFAGALEVRLGGRTVYRHGAQERPVLGDGRMPDAGHVTRAVELSRIVGVLSCVASATTAVAIGGHRSWRRRAGGR